MRNDTNKATLTAEQSKMIQTAMKYLYATVLNPATGKRPTITGRGTTHAARVMDKLQRTADRCLEEASIIDKVASLVGKATDADQVMGPHGKNVSVPKALIMIGADMPESSAALRVAWAPEA